jgi:hypothetical protein
MGVNEESPHRLPMRAIRPPAMDRRKFVGQNDFIVQRSGRTLGLRLGDRAIMISLPASARAISCDSCLGLIDFNVIRSLASLSAR